LRAGAEPTSASATKRLEGAKEFWRKPLEIEQRYVCAGASHERRDGDVRIAEGGLEHGELVAVPTELLADGGVAASQPSDGPVASYV
jgi:hypothetical protein